MRIVEYADGVLHPSPSSASRSAAPVASLPGDPWSAAEIDEAARLWNVEKLTASGIGARMRRSRNAVIGMISRNRAKFSERSGTSGTGRWTTEMLDTARRLHALGVKQYEIARTVGVSVQRLARVIDGRRDLFPRRETCAVMPDLAALAEAERREEAARARKNARQLAIRRQLAPAAPRGADYEPGLDALFDRAGKHESGTGDGPCGLMELNERRCRWPVGDPLQAGFHFCGTTIERSKIYCAGHRELAFGEGAR